MIVFTDVMERLEKHGWTTYKLRKEFILSESTLTRIRKNQPVTTETIDTLCRLCHCQPGDLMRYRRRD